MALKNKNTKTQSQYASAYSQTLGTNKSSQAQTKKSTNLADSVSNSINETQKKTNSKLKSSNTSKNTSSNKTSSNKLKNTSNAKDAIDTKTEVTANNTKNIKKTYTSAYDQASTDVNSINKAKKEEETAVKSNSNKDTWTTERAQQRIFDLKKTRNDFDTDDAYERFLTENNFSFSNGDALKYYQDKAKKNGTTAREEAQASRTKWKTTLDTEELETKYNNGELTDDDMANINNSYGVMVDTDGNKIDVDQYQKDIEAVKTTADEINSNIQSLNEKFEAGDITQENYTYMYNYYQNQWNANQEVANNLNNVTSLTGFDAYNWAKENGEDVSDFEKYAESFNDSYVERLGEQYSASLVDLVNTPVQLVDMVKQLFVDDFDVTDENNLSTKLTDQANELRTYAMAGTNGVENWSLQCISSLMPMMNAMLLGTGIVGATGATGSALTNGVNAFTNVTLGAQTAGQTTRQRIEEGSNSVSAVMNGITHGFITAMVEGFDAGRVASVFTGTAESYLTKMTLLSKASPKMIIQYLNAMGASEGAEEIVESVADYIADNIQNSIMSGLGLGEEAQVNVEELNALDLGNQFLMAYVGSVGLGLPTATKVTIDSKKTYNTAMELRTQFESTIESSLATMEEKQLAQACIEAIDADINEYNSKKTALTDSVETIEDSDVAKLGTFDEAMNNLANALRSDIQVNINSVIQTIENTNKLQNLLQENLAKNGISINANDYLNLNQEGKNNVKTISNYARNGLKNVDVSFDTSIDENGYITNYTTEEGKTRPVIVVNPNSAIAPTITTIHEAMHSIQSSGEYAKIADLLYDNKADLQKDINTLLNTSYKGASLSEARNEAIVKKTSEQLIENPTEFLNHLSKYNTDIAYKLYYDVKTALNNFVGDSKLQQIEGLLTKALNREDIVYMPDGVAYSKDENLKKWLDSARPRIQEGIDNGSITTKELNDYIKKHQDYHEDYFDDNVNKIVNGKFGNTQSHVLVMPNSPKWLSNLTGTYLSNGEMIEDFPMLMQKNHILNDLDMSNGKGNKHYVSEEVMKQLPKLLENPIGVFEYKHNGQYNGSILAFVDATDTKGVPLMVSILINGRGRYANVSLDYVTNYVTNFYAKDADKLSGFINKNLNTSDAHLLYARDGLNKKGVISAIYALQLSAKHTSPTNIVANQNNNVKSKGDTLANLKEQQNAIIQETNPRNPNLRDHTWVNSVDDILTYQEAVDEAIKEGYDESLGSTPDFSDADLKKALKTGKVTVYSSYPIENGTWVTPSRMEAQNYAGRSNRVFSKNIKLDEVAWVDTLQGQYANVNEQTSVRENQFTTIAPYRNTQVTPENFEEVRNAVIEEFTANANKVASQLGIEIANTTDNIGGYKSESGEVITEFSQTFELKNATQKQADFFASLMGDTGYETQEATISYNYVAKDDPTATGIEMRFKVKNITGVQDVLHEIGIDDFTINPYTKTISVLNFDPNDVKGACETIRRLGQRLGDNYDGAEYTKINSRYLDRSARQNLYGNGETTSIQGESWRQTIRESGLQAEAERRLNESLEQDNKVSESNDSFSNTKFSKGKTLKQLMEENGTGSKAQKTATDNTFLNGTDRELNNLNDVEEDNFLNNQNVKTAEGYANSNFANEDTRNLIIEDLTGKDGKYSKVTINGVGVVHNKTANNEAIQRIANAGSQELAIAEALNDNSLKTMETTALMCAHLDAQLGEVEQTEDVQKTRYELRKKYMEILNVAGRTVQSRQILDKASPQFQVNYMLNALESLQQDLVNERGDKAPTLKISDNLMEKFNEAKTDEERAKVRDLITFDIANQIQPIHLKDSIWGWLKTQGTSWRYLSMLGNPRTWIKNRASNFIQGYVTDINRIIQFGLETAMNDYLKKYDPSFEKTAGIGNFIPKADYDMLTNLYKTRFGDEVGKYLANDTVSKKNKSMKQTFKEDIQSQTKKFGLELFNKWQDLTTKCLSDVPDASKAFAHEVYGRLRANNITWEQLTENQKEEYIDWAKQRAQYITLNAPSEIATDLNRIQKKYGLLSEVTIGGLLPFKRTNINVAKQMISYSPIGLVKGVYETFVGVKQGKTTGTQAMLSLSQGLTGTGIVALGYMLASLGLFRTTDDDDDRKKYFDEENGEQDYAIVIPGLGSFTIDWIDPGIAPLSIGANIYTWTTEAMADGNLTWDEGKQLVTSLIFANLQPLAEQSMLESFDSALTSYNSDGVAGKLADVGQNILQNYITSFVPTLSGSIARTIDPIRRNSSYSKDDWFSATWKKIKAKIPGLSFTLDPYIDKQGDEQKQEDLGLGNIAGDLGLGEIGTYISGALGRTIQQSVLSGYWKADSNNEYDEELYRLYNETGKAEALPSNTTKSFQYENEKYNLTSKDYTNWNRIRWSKESELVNNFIDSNYYNEIGDSEKVQIINNLRSYAGDLAKDEYLASKGLTYEDTSYKKAKEATNNDLELYQYFEATSYHNEDGTTRSDYINYIQNIDTSDTGKNYLYDRYYGDSNLVTNVNSMDIDDSGKLAIKIANATAESKKDEDGNTISNSKALAVADAYADAGVLQDVFTYIEENGLAPSDLGLTKTVYKMSYEELAEKYASVWGETFGTGESINLSSGKTSSSASKKASSKRSSKTSSKSSSSTAKLDTSGLSLSTSSSGGSKSSTTNNVTTPSSNYENAYSSIMGTVNGQSKKDYGQSESEDNAGATTYCNNCGNIVTPVNGKCPICGASL